VAAFGTGASRQLQGRGGSPGFRFTLYAVLSIVVMFLDERGHWLEGARYVLQAASYPLQLAVSSPSAAWAWLQESFETRDALRIENNRLRVQERAMEVRSMRYEGLERENATLRGLRDALPPVADHWLVSEVVNVQLNSLRQRILLNRGTTNGAFKGQAVLDEKGLIGQTLHVGPWSAEVILITDPEHAVPVQVERNGLRTIAVGAGDTTSLALPYLPANADVKAGDLLLTSGLGGVFPAGYPVARITEVHRDAVQPLAQVRATPLGRVDLDREVMLVWFREAHPASPGSPTMAESTKGNASMQPQVAPPKPKPPAPVVPPAAGSLPGSPAAVPGSSPGAAAVAVQSAATPAKNASGANAATPTTKPTTKPTTNASSPRVSPPAAKPAPKTKPPVQPAAPPQPAEGAQ
jgi:rod shape-determining protein MreC